MYCMYSLVQSLQKKLPLNYSVGNYTLTSTVIRACTRGNVTELEAKFSME